jgi:hypothetical protein
MPADDLTLSGGNARMSGTVRSIDEAGVVELTSELSTGPILLKGGAVEKVEFSPQGAPPDPPAGMVELANGDLLPVKIISFDDQELRVVSPELGELGIKRDLLKSLQLGVEPWEVVYSGPRSLKEWTAGQAGSNDWVFERKALVAKGLAKAARKIEFPEQFVLRFVLKWQAKTQPNFKISFADPLTEMGVPCDRYYLQFAGAGLEVKREAAKGRRYTPVISLNRTPNRIPGRRLEVEIHVDRRDSRLKLFLNGEQEGVWADPVASVPRGSGIALECNSSGSGWQEIGGIEVLALDDSRGRHHSEERGDSSMDSLINCDDERLSGRLLGIRNEEGENLFVFKGDFQKEPLEILGKDVSTVFFKEEPGADSTDVVRPSFLLRLRGGGSLGVTSCLFLEDSVSAVHPLLGQVAIQRDGVTAMERTAETKTGGEP